MAHLPPQDENEQCEWARGHGDALCCVLTLCVWMLWIFLKNIWVCVAVCLFDYVCVPLKGACEWKEGPVVKGWQRCHASFTLNEYLIKTLPFNSQRLLCFKASSHNVRCGGGGWGGEQNGQCGSLTTALTPVPFFFFFNPSSHTHFPLPSIYLSLFFLYCLSLWMVLFCWKTPFMSSLISAFAFCLSLPCLRLYEEKCFAGFHHHYCPD